MKIRLGIAAAVAVFSGVILFGQSAHAETKHTETSTKEKQETVVVKQGDTLTSIADDHKTTIAKLYNANKSIDNPNTIDVGDKIRIPAKDEKLKDRFSEFQNQPVAAQPAATETTEYAPSYSQTYTPGSEAVYATDSSGNTYFKGYCTWYAKSRRPDLPNMLGNGGEWAANAAAQGFKTGATPKVGAIAETNGHVGYVEKVNKNGTIVMSDMNGRAGYGNVGKQTVSGSNYHYIYK